MHGAAGFRSLMFTRKTRLACVDPFAISRRLPRARLMSRLKLGAGRLLDLNFFGWRDHFMVILTTAAGYECRG